MRDKKTGPASLREQAEKAAGKLATDTLHQAVEGVHSLMQTWSSLPLPTRLRNPWQASLHSLDTTSPPPRQIGSDGIHPNPGVPMARTLRVEEIQELRQQIQAVLDGLERLRPLTERSEVLAMMTPEEKNRLLERLLRLPPTFARAQSAFNLLASCTSHPEWKKVTAGIDRQQWELWTEMSGAEAQCQTLWQLWSTSTNEPPFLEMPHPLPRLTPPTSLTRVQRISAFHRIERHRQWFDLLQEPRIPRLLQVLQSQRTLKGLSLLQWVELQEELFAIVEEQRLSSRELRQEIESLRQAHKLSSFAMRTLFLERLSEIWTRNAGSLHEQAHRLRTQLETGETEESDKGTALVQVTSLLEQEVPFLLKRARQIRRLYPTSLSAREELSELLLLLHKVLLQLTSYLEPSLQSLPPLQRTMLISVQLLPFVARVVEGNRQEIQQALQGWVQVTQTVLGATMSQARKLSAQAVDSTRSLLQGTQTGRNLATILDRWQEQSQELDKKVGRTQSLVGMNRATSDVLVGLKDGSLTQTREGAELWTQHALSLVQDVSRELLKDQWKSLQDTALVEVEIAPEQEASLSIDLSSVMTFLQWLWGPLDPSEQPQAMTGAEKEKALEELLQFLDEGLVWFQQWVLQREQQKSLSSSDATPMSPGATALLDSLEQLREYLEERSVFVDSLQNYSHQLWQRWQQEENGQLNHVESEHHSGEH